MMRVDYNPVNVPMLRNWPRWVEMIRDMDSRVEEKQPALWYHGVEHIRLYDRIGQELADRQWFSKRRSIAEIYVEVPGYCLELLQNGPLRVVRARQNIVVNHAVTQELLKEIGRERMPPIISQWDVPEVQLKRWFLLPALRIAHSDENIVGFIDNDENNDEEMYIQDVSAHLSIINAFAIDTEKPRSFGGKYIPEKSLDINKKKFDYKVLKI